MTAQTHDELNPYWRIIADSVIGATHERSDKPNQDALRWLSTKEAVMLAISDGHGSDRYFRSDEGSKIAVEVAIERMAELANYIAKNPQDMTFIKKETAKFPELIVAEWRKKVEVHASNIPLTREEEKRFQNQPALFVDVDKNPSIPYGATLLAMIMTETFFFCLQLGDGDITFVRENGEIVRPMAEDRRLLANETTSLCTDTAIKDFRQKFYQRKNDPPALIMLSTDGYANSFSTPQGFHQVGIDILKKLYEDNGLNDVKLQLREWLQAATKTGSGDDITVGIMCYQPIISRRPAPIIEAPPPLVEDNVPPPSQNGYPYLSQPDVQGNNNRLPGGSLNEKVALDAPTERASVPQFGKHGKSGPLGAAYEQPAVQHPQQKKKFRPQSVIVSQQGGGDCNTIREALNLVAPGGSIHVKSGIYPEFLHIKESVQLIAEGDVRIEYPVPCMDITAQNVIMKYFRIRGISQNVEKMYAIRIAAKGCQIIACNISSESTIGIQMSGKETEATLRDCQIHHIQDVGVLLKERCSLILEDCTIQHIGKTGIRILEGAQALINGGFIKNNYYGLTVMNGSLKIERCNFSQNSMNIRMHDIHYASLKNCTYQ